MSGSIKLLDDAKVKLGIESDYALAKAMGVSKATVSNYYAGITHPNDDNCIWIAETLELPLPYVLAAVALSRNHYSRAVAGWEALYDLARRDAIEGGEL